MNHRLRALPDRFKGPKRDVVRELVAAVQAAGGAPTHDTLFDDLRRIAKQLNADRLQLLVDLMNDSRAAGIRAEQYARRPRP